MTANAALFIGWGQAIPGREQKALQVFNEGIQYWSKLQQQGMIESFEPFLLEPHGGDLAGSRRAMDTARRYQNRRNVHEARAGSGYKRAACSHDEESVSISCNEHRSQGHRGKIKELHTQVVSMFREARRLARS